MARGWESKSVEIQIENSNSDSPEGQQTSLSTQERRTLIKRKDLILSRKFVMHQLESSTSDRYAEFLRRSLAALEAQIAALS
jgi:hypothetical protein